MPGLVRPELYHTFFLSRSCANWKLSDHCAPVLFLLIMTPIKKDTPFWKFNIKEAIINSFMVTMDHMTACIRGVVQSDKPTENHHLTFQLPLAPFSYLFWFMSSQVYCFASLPQLSCTWLIDMNDSYFSCVYVTTIGWEIYKLLMICTPVTGPGPYHTLYLKSVIPKLRIQIHNRVHSTVLQQIILFIIQSSADCFLNWLSVLFNKCQKTEKI